MVSKALKLAAVEVGYHYVEKLPLEDSYLYGINNDYLVSLYDRGNVRSAFINYFIAKDEDDNSIQIMDLSEKIKSEISSESVHEFDISSKGVYFSVSCSPERIIEIIDNVIQILIEKEICGTTKCCYCGNKIGSKPPKRILKGKNSYFSCEHCALEELEKGQNSVPTEESVAEKKRILPVIGALVGGILGFIIYFLGYNFIIGSSTDSSFDLRFIFTSFGFITAVLAYLGYVIFNKKFSKLEITVVSISSIVFTALGQYMGSFASYAKMQNFTLGEAFKVPSMWLVHLRTTIDTTLTYEKEILEKYNVSSDFYKLLLLSLLFAIIGTVLFQLSLYEKSKPKIEKTEVETFKINQIRNDSEKTDS